MESVYPDLFDAVPDALIVVDDAGRIALANRQAEHMFGYPAKGLAGAAIEDLLPEEFRARHRTHRAGYMARPRVRPMGATGQTLVGLRLDGTQFPVEIALSPVDSPGGRRFLASIRDISETQLARQALVRAGYDALVASIGQLALEADDEADVIDEVPWLLAEALHADAVAIALVRDGGHVELRAAVGMGSGQRRIDGAALTAALASAAPLVVDDFGGADAAAVAAFGQQREGSGALMPLIDRDHPIGALIAWSGQVLHFDHDALHLLRSVANLLAVLVQRRHTEEQLAHAQRLDALGQLTGGIAHDFNNLLTVMSGTLQLLDLDAQDRPEAHELIATALRSAARGAELTAKLLAFARRQRLLPRATDARELLRDVGLMLRRTLGNTVQLDITADHDLSAAFVDPIQLEAALVNLALNARDAMPGGGTISIRARNELVDAGRSSRELPVGHYILVTVTDTGHGMSREVLARAMEPFFTTKESGRGSGLGLSMVYGFAKQSGGHLQIDSAPGQGTHVALYLPATEEAVRPVSFNGRDLPPGSGETILVVEDDPAVRSICVAFLRSAAYEVVTAINATDALAVLQRTPGVALVFTDVMLGKGRDGVQLATEIQRIRPGLPVLLTSGYEEQAAPDHARFELLRKPYRRAQLLTAVGRLLAGVREDAAT